MKFLNSISRGGYLPLNNVVYNVYLNLIVTTEKEAIWRHFRGGITAVVIGELREREESCLDSLIFGGIGAEVVLDYPIEGLALAIGLGVVGS